MPDFFVLFQKYFWFLGVILGLVNFFSLRTRVLQTVVQNPALENGVNSILAGCLVFATVPYLALAVLQTLGGYQTALFFYYAPLADPLEWLALGVPLACFLFLSYWVLFRDGATKMIAYGIANGDEKRVKLFVALAPLIFIAAIVFGRFFFAGSPFKAAP